MKKGRKKETKGRIEEGKINVHLFFQCCYVFLGKMTAKQYCDSQKCNVNNLPVNAGDVGSIPRLGRSPGEGNGNPLQYSCLENPMDRGAWRATVHGVAKSWM